MVVVIVVVVVVVMGGSGGARMARGVLSLDACEMGLSTRWR